MKQRCLTEAPHPIPPTVPALFEEQNIIRLL